MTRTVAAPDTERLGGHRHPEPAPIPAGTEISLHRVPTTDGATVGGTLFHPPGATTCVTVIHPRLDMSGHPMIGLLLKAGVAVWSQGMRGGRHGPCPGPRTGPAGRRRGVRDPP